MFSNGDGVDFDEVGGNFIRFVIGVLDVRRVFFEFIFDVL